METDADSNSKTPVNRATEIAFARESDEKISALWNIYWAAQEPVDAIHARVKRINKSRRLYKTGEADVLIEKTLAKLSLYEEAVEVAREAASELNRELYTGWNRFYLVQHIHNTNRCSSFRPRTKIGWLPKVSGLTEAEAVAEYGAILCTICFPSAPLEYTSGVKDDRCPGSGKLIDETLGGRTGGSYGNWATCADCGKRVGLGKNAWKIPKHVAAVTA